MKNWFGKKLKFLAAIIFLMGGLILNSPSLLIASDESIAEEIDKLKTKISKLESHLSTEDKKETDSSGELIIGGGATFVIQGSHNTNTTEKKGKDVTDGTFSIDLEMEKGVGNRGNVFVHLEGGNGAGFDGEEVITFSGVNADATGGDGNIAVIEAWYEHNFNDKVTLTFGKIDATCYLDDNALANDECVQFLGAAFKNSTALEFPDDNGLGLRIALNPLEKLEANIGVLEADAEWEDVADDVFIFGQVNLKPDLGGREGNYRLYGWLNSKAHTKLTDTSKEDENNYGFGISFDQELTDNVAVFLRFGWQDPSVSDIKTAWSSGIQLLGKFWQREEDVLGIAFGQNMPFDDFGKVGNPNDNETHMEAYYNYYVNEALSVSPDIQMILNPNGVGSSLEGRDDNIYIFGVRAQLGF